MSIEFKKASGNLANAEGNIYQKIDHAIKEMTGFTVQELADRNRLYEAYVNGADAGCHVFHFDPRSNKPGEYTEDTESIIKDMCSPGLFYFDPKEGNRPRFIRVEVDGKPLSFTYFEDSPIFKNRTRLENGKDIRLEISEPLSFNKGGKNEIKELLEDLVKPTENEFPVLEEPKKPLSLDEPIAPAQPEVPEPLGFWSSLISGILGVFGVKTEAKKNYEASMKRYTDELASFDDRMLDYRKEKAQWDKEKPVYEEKMAAYQQELDTYKSKKSELEYTKSYIKEFKNGAQKLSEHVNYYSIHADEKQKEFENERDLAANLNTEKFQNTFGLFQDRDEEYWFSVFRDDIRKLAYENPTLYDAVSVVAKKGPQEPDNLGEIYSAYRESPKHYENGPYDLVKAFKDAAKKGSLEERLEIALSDEKLYGTKEVDTNTIVDDSQLIKDFTNNIKKAAKESPEVAKLVLAIGAKAPGERGSMKQYFDAFKADPKLDMGKFLTTTANIHEHDKNVSEKVKTETKILSADNVNKSSIVG